MEKFTVLTLPKMAESSLPMAFPFENKNPVKSGIILAADVGGTKTELALFEIKNGELTSLKNQRYPTTDHQSFVKAIHDFHSDPAMLIDAACLGVAGTVDGDKVKGVNFAWEIDAKILEKDLKITSVYLINDLEANAFGLAALKKSDFIVLAKGEVQRGNAAIISPGTGLGEAGLFWDGSTFHPYASEGGHCNFSPTDDLDIELLKNLKTKFEHVSWERVISGQGIHNIYQFLREFRDIAEPEWLTEKLKKEDPPKVISTAALENKNKICVETLELFLKYLAIECAQLALKSKATSGIFIGGGIVPKILPLVNKEEFYKNFINVGRMKHLLSEIPIKIVLNDKTALMGAAYFASRGIKK